MKIIKGIVPEPQKVVIYGPQGIGKSSLAALFPSPIFLDTEKGSRRLDLDRLEIGSLEEFIAGVTAIKTQPDFKDYQTVVVDTADWLEAKVKEKVVAQYSAKDRAYDREGSFIGDEMMKLLTSLDVFVSAGKHVVLLAHSATVKIDLPDQQASFDRYELDMNKKHVAPIVKHWCDHLLFMRYKLRVREVDDGKNKALGGEVRLLCTSTTASYDAKNRSKEEPLHGEFECKSPADGIAIIKRIFASVSAPWDKQVTPAPQPEQKPAEEKTVIEKAKERGVGQPKDPDGIPGLAPENGGPKGHPLDTIIGEHEDSVNAFLVTRREIQEGQTYRDARPDYVARILKNPVLFLQQATKGTGVAA